MWRFRSPHRFNATRDNIGVELTVEWRVPSEAPAYRNRWARPGFMNCVFRFDGTPGMIEALSRCHAMIDEKKLEERLVALEAAKSWSPRVVSRLEMLLRSGADEALYRINPIQFATEKSIAEAEAIDLFLHACVAGLFDMDWLLVCPMCSDVVESFRTLRKLHTHFHCHLCQSDYDAALDDYIAVTFTVSPAVRRIRFHKPDAL